MIPPAPFFLSRLFWLHKGFSIFTEILKMLLHFCEKKVTGNLIGIQLNLQIVLSRINIIDSSRLWTQYIFPSVCDYDVNCRFSTYGFYHAKVCSLYVHFLKIFFYHRLLNFIKKFSCIYWAAHMIFIVQFLKVVYHADWFGELKNSCILWINLTVHSPFSVFLELAWGLVFCWGFFHLFASVILACNFCVWYLCLKKFTLHSFPICPSSYYKYITLFYFQI